MEKQDLKSNRSNGHKGIDPKNPLVAIASPSTKLLDDLKDTINVLDSFEVMSEITISGCYPQVSQESA